MNTPSGYPVKRINVLIAINLVVLAFGVFALWRPATTPRVAAAAPEKPKQEWNTTGRVKILKLVENSVCDPACGTVKNRDYTVIDVDGRQLYLMTLCPEVPKLGEGWIVRVTYKIEPKAYNGCHEVSSLVYIDQTPQGP